MKIAVFTNQFPAKISTFLARDLYLLVKSGIMVDLYTVYPVHKEYWQFVPSSLRLVLQKEVKIRFLLPLHFQQSPTQTCEDIPTILKQSLSYGVLHFFKSLWVIRQAALWSHEYDENYDYMLSYWGNYAGTYAYLANKGLRYKIPYSFFLHAGTDLYRDQIYLEQKIQYARKVFTVCEFNKRFLQNLYPSSYHDFESKVSLYHLGIDLDELKFQVDDREPTTLLTIGTFHHQKGFTAIIEALPYLVPQFDAIKIIMIGDGPQKNLLVKTARKYGVENRITFTGHLPFEEVKKYLAKATLLIHPSNELGDAVPTVIKEALASGLPVIGADNVGIPELLDFGNAGILFHPNDIKELVKSISFLLQDKDKRLKLARIGRLFAENKFDMYKNGKILVQQLLEKMD